MQIRIGTRKSKLALIQAELVIARIKQEFPEARIQVVPIITSGDRITNKNLYDIGGKALFLKEIEEQLIDNKIDIAVHSLKDVPGILPNGLFIGAVLVREDARDVLISAKYNKIEQISNNAKVGTSSPRRKVIIQKINPNVEIVQFRGNINNRLEKLKRGEVDVTILALAGLKRANLFNPEYCYPISVDEMLPAAGQGIIAVEICTDNKEMKKLCKAINHLPTWYLAKAERGFLEFLDASCKTPLSAYAVYEGDKIKARYMISDYEGSFISYHTEIGEINNATEIGELAARSILRTF